MFTKFFLPSALVGLSLAAPGVTASAQENKVKPLDRHFGVIVNAGGITLIDRIETKPTSVVSTSTATLATGSQPTHAQNGSSSIHSPTKTSSTSLTLELLRTIGKTALPLPPGEDLLVTDPLVLGEFLRGVEDRLIREIAPEKDSADTKTSDEPSKTYSLEPEIGPSCVASDVACKDASSDELSDDSFDESATSAAAAVTIPTPAFIIFGGVLVGASVAMILL